MSLLTLAALACTTLALLPLVAYRERWPLNPALFVFLSVAWGFLLKALYIDLWRDRPRPIVHDQIYVGATSRDFLTVGAVLLLVATCAYVIGFFSIGRRTFRFRTGGAASRPLSGYARAAIISLALLCFAAFVAYLYTSGTNLLETPLSAKRFGAEDTGASSRFLYLPYYFFKLATFSSPLAYAIAFGLVVTTARKDRRFLGVAFAGVYTFALFLAHFASLRLVIGLLALQIALLLFRYRAAHLVRFMSAFALLTAASFAVITFVNRAPRDINVVRQETLARRAREAARARQAAAPPDAGRSAETPPSTAAGPGIPRSGDRPAGTPPEPGAARGDGRPEGPPADEGVGEDASPVDGAGNDMNFGPLEGRYFLDFTKLAHIAHYFPDRRAHLLGGGMIRAVVPTRVSDDVAGGSALTIDRYLAVEVFDEARNSVPPGYAGELYIDFGTTGLVLGFLFLGVFHRLLFNHLTLIRMPGYLVACAIILIPNTTVILLNTGVLPAASACAIGIGMVSLVWLPDALRDATRRGGADHASGAEA